MVAEPTPAWHGPKWKGADIAALSTSINHELIGADFESENSDAGLSWVLSSRMAYTVRIYPSTTKISLNPREVVNLACSLARVWPFIEPTHHVGSEFCIT